MAWQMAQRDECEKIKAGRDGIKNETKKWRGKESARRR